MRGVDAETARDIGSDITERGARAQAFGAIEMGREVAVAEIEPRLAVKTSERAERVEGLALETPAVGLIDDAGERIGDGVNVRRDVESERTPRRRRC